MPRSRSFVVASLAVAVAALALAGGSYAQRFVPTDDPAHPRLRFADSLDSANDRCMVRGSRLNARIPPQYVNGVPLGFC